MLHDGYAHFFIAIGSHQLANGAFEVLPGADFRRQDVIHAPDGLDLLRQNQPPSATGFARTTWPERLMENCTLPSGRDRFAIALLCPLNSTETPDALPNTTRNGAVPTTV